MLRRKDIARKVKKFVGDLKTRNKIDGNIRKRDSIKNID